VVLEGRPSLLVFFLQQNISSASETNLTFIHQATTSYVKNKYFNYWIIVCTLGDVVG
jgi:hypothetical protein